MQHIHASTRQELRTWPRRGSTVSRVVTCSCACSSNTCCATPVLREKARHWVLSIETCQQRRAVVAGAIFFTKKNVGSCWPGWSWCWRAAGKSCERKHAHSSALLKLQKCWPAELGACTCQRPACRPLSGVILGSSARSSTLANALSRRERRQGRFSVGGGWVLVGWWLGGWVKGAPPEGSEGGAPTASRPSWRAAGGWQEQSQGKGPTAHTTHPPV